MSEYDIALKTTNELVYSGKSFTYEENVDKVIENQKNILGHDKSFFGLVRLAPGFSLGEYYRELTEDGIIKLSLDKNGKPYYQLNQYNKN